MNEEVLRRCQSQWRTGPFSRAAWTGIFVVLDVATTVLGGRESVSTGGSSVSELRVVKGEMSPPIYG